MEKDALARLRRLKDRQAIYDCLTAYCRAVDRLDRELLLSAFHPDAIDNHGVFVGSPVDLADWIFALHSTEQRASQHLLCNHRCDLQGDTAHAETYYLVASVAPAGQLLPLSGGRYVDRLERRGDRWAIAARKCVFEWRGPVGAVTLHPGADTLVLAGPNTRDPGDASYERPLTIAPARLGQTWPPFDHR